MAIVKHLFKDHKATSPFLVDILGSVTLGASGAITATAGKGFTVSKSGTGAYTIVLDAQSGVPAILVVNANIVAVAPSAVYVVSAVAATGTIVLNTALVAAPGTIANLAAGTLNFRITVQNARYVG